MKDFLIYLSANVRWMFLSKNGKPTKTLVIVMLAVISSSILTLCGIRSWLPVSLLFFSIAWLPIGMICWIIEAGRNK